MGDICKICKKGGQLFATHCFIKSRKIYILAPPSYSSSFLKYEQLQQRFILHIWQHSKKMHFGKILSGDNKLGICPLFDSPIVTLNPNCASMPRTKCLIEKIRWSGNYQLKSFWEKKTAFLLGISLHFWLIVVRCGFSKVCVKRLCSLLRLVKDTHIKKTKTSVSNCSLNAGLEWKNQHIKGKYRGQVSKEKSITFKFCTGKKQYRMICQNELSMTDVTYVMTKK